MASDRRAPRSHRKSQRTGDALSPKVVSPSLEILRIAQIASASPHSVAVADVPAVADGRACRSGAADGRSAAARVPVPRSGTAAGRGHAAVVVAPEGGGGRSGSGGGGDGGRAQPAAPTATAVRSGASRK